MKKKIMYKRAGYGGLYICVFVLIFILAIAFASSFYIEDAVSSGLIYFVVFMCGICIYEWLKVKKYRDEIKSIIKNGKLQVGKVVGKQIATVTRSTSYLNRNQGYIYQIEFWDEEKSSLNQFWTPVTICDFELDSRLHCDVYQCGDKLYANNFRLA